MGVNLGFSLVGSAGRSCWDGKWDGGTLGEQILLLIPNFQAEEQLREVSKNPPFPQPAPNSAVSSSEEFWRDQWG